MIAMNGSATPTISPAASAAPSGGSAPPGSSAPASALTGGASMGQDDFLKLLVAQMRNQDPTNPMQSQEMAAQLAQFSSLNQLIGMNATLASQAQASQTIADAVNLNTATATLGRTVMAFGNQVAVGADTAPEVTVDVGGTGGRATVTLFDAHGYPVASDRVGVIGGGLQTIALGPNASALPPGAYTYQVTFDGVSGSAAQVTTYTVGTVDSLQATSSGPVLTAGPLSIPLSSVSAIR